MLNVADPRELLQLTRAVLLMNVDNATAWNIRYAGKLNLVVGLIIQKHLQGGRKSFWIRALASNAVFHLRLEN